MSGRRKSVRSQASRPSGFAVHTRQASTPTSARIAPTHQYVWSAALTDSKICVGSGIVWPRSWKIDAKRGMTKVIRNTMAPAPTVVMTSG